MFEWFTLDALLIIFAIAGIGFVTYRVFSDEKGAHRDRREEGFNIFDQW